MVSIGLVVPVYKNFQGFAELMRSVDVPVEPIVIDNWRDNRGVSGGWNEGIVHAEDLGLDVAIVANDDITFAPGTIRKLAAAVQNQPYDLITAYNTRDEDYSHLSPRFIESPDYACFAVRPGEFLEKFGEFDENFKPAYFEDNDMHYRIKLLGGSDMKATSCPMFHKGSVTQNWEGGQVVTGHMFETNRAYYIRKWGGTPDSETYTTPFGEVNKSPKDW